MGFKFKEELDFGPKGTKMLKLNAKKLPTKKKIVWFFYIKFLTLKKHGLIYKCGYTIQW